VAVGARHRRRVGPHQCCRQSMGWASSLPGAAVLGERRHTAALSSPSGAAVFAVAPERTLSSKEVTEVCSEGFIRTMVVCFEKSLVIEYISVFLSLWDLARKGPASRGPNTTGRVPRALCSRHRHEAILSIGNASWPTPSYRHVLV